jgi:UDP-2,4-diacetamido-2,4,6-trideoxy-beta-L-altropyranose hydrolase
MTIVFRADASSTIGHGHVMRCLSLAHELRDWGAHCMFVSRPEDGDLRDHIARSGFEQFPIADMSAATMSAVLGAVSLRPEWLVVDHYQLDREWESEMRRDVDRIRAIDDRPPRPHDCDVLLDQNLSGTDDAPIDATGAQALIGVEYALLQPEYRQLRRDARPRSGQLRRVLITFGGSDRHGLTLSALHAVIDNTGSEVQIDVVIPSANQYRGAIESVANACPRVQVHKDLPTLAPLILAADLGIGAAGSTSWERLCLGLPSIVITLGENQVPIAMALDQLGLAKWIGHPAEALAALPSAIATIVAKGLDKEWSRRCLAHVAGKGASRVAAVLIASESTLLRARLAERADEARLLRWANDPVTRKDSFSQRSITPAEHHQWLQRVLSDDAARQFIVETHQGAEVGQGRFQRHDGEWEVHYAVAPEFRGRRLGTPLLRAALDEFGREHRGRVIGRVKTSNVASQKIFQALGFERDRADADTITYVRIQ